MSDERNENLRVQLERLPAQIRQYYDVYFSELRGQLARQDLFFEAVPDYLKGYKRVISIGGKDGVLVAHFPIELEITLSETDTGRILGRFRSVLNAEADTFEFITFPGSPVSNIASFISGGEEDIGTDVLSQASWGTAVAGVLREPQLKVDLSTGQISWQAPWTRLYFADFNYLHFWEDTERAKIEAWEDIRPYVRGREYEELDEIRAPVDIQEAEVRAGDRGVVVEVLDSPSPALLVEYADLEGRTKALVTYSIDLERILDVFLNRDFLTNVGQLSYHARTLRGHTFDFPANSSVVRDRLVDQRG